MTNERRADPRANLSLEVRWEGLSGKHEARISDISIGGCFIDTSGAATVGELIVFEIKMPSGEWFELRGKVAFYQPNIGFSLSFSYIAEEERRAIAQLIDRQN